MSEHVSNDPLERLVARLIESKDVGTAEMMVMPAGDPLERLDGLIAAAHDLSPEAAGESAGGVLGELLERIELARAIEGYESGALRDRDGVDPRATIAGWIADECAAVGCAAAITRIADGAGVRVGERDRSDVSVEAAVGRAVLSMVGASPLSATSRRKAVELLASALDGSSPDALRAVLRVLIAEE